MSEDETALMAQVGAGNREGLGPLYDRHHGPLYGFFFNLTGCRAASEDLVHEVFLRVLRYAHSFQGGAPFRPWLYRIARNVLADRRGPAGVEDLDDSLPCPEPGPEVRMTDLQDRARLERALATLPRAQRELLLLSRDPDLSSRDLAALFGCSEAALRVRVHRALVILRRAFFDLPGGER